MAAAAATGRVVSPSLIGRLEELRLVAAAVAAPPAVAVVEGEAGIGKTRLVAELRTRPDISDRRFVVGTCRSIREPFPLGPLVEAVRDLAPELTSGFTPVVGALRPLLPEVASVLPPQPTPLEDRSAERHRVFRGLVEVMRSLGPAVLVLEDLHWADRQTIDFVGYLLGDPPPELSVVLTFRGEEVHPEVRTLTSRLPASVGRVHAILAPLDQHQTGELAAAILGADGLSEEFAARLCERASGLPLAIEELLALLRARGTLVRRGVGWSRRTLNELHVPSGIRDPVLERVSRLSDDARSVVEAAAVLQTPVSTAVLTTACRTPSARVARGLDQALDSGLLAEYGQAVGFRHLLAAQAVYGALPGHRRRRLHSAAAAALEAVDPVPLGQLAHHLRQAGRLDEWVRAAEGAADQAVKLGHDGEAVRLLEEVLAHARLDSDQRGRLAVKLGWAAVETVHDQPIGPLSEVLDADELGLPRSVRGELRLVLAMLLEQTARDPVRQRQLYAEAVSDLARPDFQARAMVALGLPTTVGVPLSEHKVWLDRSLRVLPSVDDPAFETFLLGKVAMVLALMGDPDWGRLTERIENQTAGTPRHRREVNAYHSVGMLACYTGHLDTADRLLRRGLAGPATKQSKRLELRLRAAIALLEYCRGSWDGLDDEVDVLLAELADYQPARNDVEVVAGCLMLARGDLDTAERRLAGIVRRVEEGLDGFDLLPATLAGLLRMAVVHRQLDAVLESTDRFFTILELKQMWAPVGRVLPAAVQAMLVAGRAGDADALVHHCRSGLRELDVPLGPPALRTAEGFLAADQSHWRTAADHFLTAGDTYESLQCPYEAAQAHEQGALALLGAEDESAARPLRAAVATYERLGATWDLNRARGLARQHHISLPARHRGGRQGYGSALSPREREVAELAATGQTNKQIARELFVSPNTVNRHLTAAMHKLGVGSRAAIGPRLGNGEQVDTKDGVTEP